MTMELFEARLRAADTPLLLAKLAYEIIEDSLYEESPEAMQEFLCQISRLLDAGLDPDFVIDDAPCVWNLQYGYTDYHLDAAKLVFDRHGLPYAKVEDDVSDFFSWIGSKLDYNYYDCDFIVKLYLLCTAYTTEETYIRFEEHLCPEMFESSSSFHCSESSVPFHLTPEIFKDIHQFDYMIEWLPPQNGQRSAWKLHIFHKASHIKIATYE